MKAESYLEKEVVKIPEFKVGGEYRDEQGHEYRVLSINGDIMEAKFNFVKKKFKIIRYGSTYAAFNSGRVWFRSADPDPSLIERDWTCDITPRGKYNSLKEMTPEEKRAYRRERAKKRRKARREAKAASINKPETGAN